jgi:hypothetical protein
LRLFGDGDFEKHSGEGLKNFGTDVPCSELEGGFNGAKIGFVFYTIREIFRNQNGKNREIKYNSGYIVFLSQ